MLDHLGTLPSSRTAAPLLLLAAGLAALALSFVRLPYLDRAADEYFQKSIKASLITYGTLRTVNAAISLVQESEVEASPAGIGLSIAAGQVLDPVNDIVERGSNLMETSIMAMGALKILKELADLIALRLLAGLLLLAALLRTFRALHGLVALISKLCLVLLIARLALPAAGLANLFLDTIYFDGRIKAQQTRLEPFADVSQQPFRATDVPDDRSFMDHLQEVLNPATYLKKLQTSYSQVKENAGHIVESTVQMSILYLGKLLFQVVLIPVLSFWLLLKTVDALFSRDMSRQFAGRVSETFRSRDAAVQAETSGRGEEGR